MGPGRTRGVYIPTPQPTPHTALRELAIFHKEISSRIKGPGDIKRKLIKNSSLGSNCIIKSIDLACKCKLGRVN